MTYDESEKLRRLYELYEQPMYRIAYAVFHSSELAEDAVSEAFIRIIENLHKVGEPEAPKSKSYIIRIIKSATIDLYRKRRHFYLREIAVDYNESQLIDECANVEEKILSSVINGELGKMLCSLGETDRSIIRLRCIEDLPWKEVAKQLSLTESNVRKRFERIRKKLTEMKGEIDV